MKFKEEYLWLAVVSISIVLSALSLYNGNKLKLLLGVVGILVGTFMYMGLKRFGKK